MSFEACCSCQKNENETQSSFDRPAGHVAQHQKPQMEDAEPDAFAAKELQRKAAEEKERDKKRQEDEERRAKEQLAKKQETEYAQADPAGDQGNSGSANEFTVTITRSIGEAVGLDIDHIDGVSAVVVALKNGAILNWNDNNRDKEIKPGDRIIEVNGSRGDVQQLIAKLKTDLTWRLSVQRPVELNVTIHKANAPSLGLDLKYAPNSKSLLITDVANGPMQDWNNEHPDKVVKSFDRIVEINGARGKPQDLIQASDGKDTLEMVIAHYPN